jgi:mannosyltransferase OCH1-like enzyme
MTRERVAPGGPILRHVVRSTRRFADAPKILHQTWRDRVIPARWRAMHEGWRRQLPHWKHRLWTDEENRALVAEHYAWFLPYYDAYPQPIMRADAARYFILHREGGAYADLDLQCLRPIDDLLLGREVVFGLEPTEHVDEQARAAGLDWIVCNAFMASPPGHPFWEFLFEALGKAAREPDPLNATGPYLLSRACREYGERHRLSMLSPTLMYPLSKDRIGPADGPQPSVSPQAFAVHHWHGSWWRDAPSTVVDTAKPTPTPVASPAAKATEASVLILTPLKNATRFLERYAANLARLTYPREQLSVAFLEGDSDDGSFEAAQALLPALAARLRDARLFRRDFGFRHVGPRWRPEIQRPRRAALARSRNHLLSRALTDETQVLWLDVDLATYPDDLIECMLAPGRSIVAAHCVREAGGATYDLNTFRYREGGEALARSTYLIDGILQPPRGEGRLYLEDLRDQDLVEVDAVGGCALLVDADLHRDGLVFPCFPYKGYLETEGLAVMARDMGVTCHGLPRLEVVHS